MSQFYDLASLVVIPSGYKASTIYAQKPLTTDGQLSFSRASTATRVNASGLIETVASNVPRLDYLGSSCPRLLLEPQRTNSAQYSEQADNAWWLKFQATITANQATAPDGTISAERLTASGATAVIYRTGMTAGALSFFIKAETLSGGARFSILVDGVGNATWSQDGTLFSVTGGTATNAVNYGNGWYRCVLNVTSGSIINFGLENAVSGNSAFIWGIQNEASATYATSYVPTTSASVTRVADTYQKAGFGNTSTAGTLFYEFNAVNINSSNGMYLIGLGVGNTDTLGTSYATAANSLSIIANGSVLQGRNNGYATTLFSSSPVTGSNQKIAIRYDGTNVVAFVNGVKGTVFADTAVGVKNFIRVNNGEETSHASKQLLFFPTALTDVQCIELTTL